MTPAGQPCSGKPCFSKPPHPHVRQELPGTQLLLYWALPSTTSGRSRSRPLPGVWQSLMVLDRRWSGQAEEVQRAVEGLVGHLAEPGGDIRVACRS